MRYEVEQKYRVDNLADVRRAVIELGATESGKVTQIDTYYAHPGRDFATTDEALRIRRVNQENCLTYKGPKIDQTTKTRQEIEIEIAAGDHGAEASDQLLQALGFRPVANVSKVRQPYRLDYQRHSVEVAIDQVNNVGDFVELEIVAAGEAEVNSADALEQLAQQLSLSDVERRSYLELLLA